MICKTIYWLMPTKYAFNFQVSKHQYYHHPVKTQRALSVIIHIGKGHLSLVCGNNPFLVLGLYAFSCCCFLTGLIAYFHLNKKTHIFHFALLSLHHSTLQTLSQFFQHSSLFKNLSHGCTISGMRYVSLIIAEYRGRGKGEKMRVLENCFFLM